jgi:hypothetical protein
MAIGPLETFVFPGVFTRTITEAAGTSAAGDIRFPAIIGVGFEQIRVSDFEMIRGSSAIADNLILEEAITGTAISTTDSGWVGGAQGTVNTFRVASFPIVTGDGTGKVATLPRNVIVTVNGESVAVNAVNGLTGEVTLVEIPSVNDVVRANYYFKRRDTYNENESVSFQADGSTVNFKVLNSRIVKGNNGGQSATDADISAYVDILYNPNPAVVGDEYTKTVPVIQVKVNSVITTITALDGAHGIFTLGTAPALGATVTVTYFSSLWQNTYDILPAATVNTLIKVGLSSDTSDYSIGQDCVLAGENNLHWGTSYQTSAGTYTSGSTPLVNNVVASLTDTRVFGRVATPSTPATDVNGAVLVDTNGNELNLDGNKSFVLSSNPVDGVGTDTATENPANMIAYVGPDWQTAYSNGAVVVNSIVDNVITLAVSPSQGAEDKVYVTYYENLIVDDTWTITNEVSGGSGVGRYSVYSKFNGTALDVTLAAGGSIAPQYAGSGAVNVQVDPIVAGVETVTVTFDGVGGFAVTSTGLTGTGTTNTGDQGRTYVDPVTHFRVSFANVGTFNPINGDTIIYDVGNPLEIAAQQSWFYAKSSIVKAIPGMNITVATTAGGTVDNTGDTVTVESFSKSGNEPEVGDSYYVTFDKDKTDYTTKYYTAMRDVYRDFGPLDITNKVVVGANLAFINGARAVAIKQILKEPGQPDASFQAYVDGIDSFDEPLANGQRPSFMQPMSTDSRVHSYLKTSNAIQCSIKYRNERTSIVGFAFGTTAESAIQQCKALATEKITPVYPEAAVLSIPDAYGTEVQYLVDGSFIAVALSGLDSSPATDIATPLTNKTITGFDRLYRRLDEVTAALVANAGCTTLDQVGNLIRIKMYLTSDLSNALTRDPRIVEVKHYVQQGVRRNLDQFIGQKNLPSIIPQITRSVNSYFSVLKNSQLIVDFKGIYVAQNPNEPSTVDVEVFYSPVFPLNWIIVTLNLRQSV